MDSNEKTIPGGVEQAEPENTENTLDPGGTPPAPEMTAEEAAALAGEGEKALRDIGEEQLEPAPPFDVSGEHIPGPGDHRFGRG